MEYKDLHIECASYVDSKVACNIVLIQAAYSVAWTQEVGDAVIFFELAKKQGQEHSTDPNLSVCQLELEHAAQEKRCVSFVDGSLK